MPPRQAPSNKAAALAGDAAGFVSARHGSRAAARMPRAIVKVLASGRGSVSGGVLRFTRVRPVNLVDTDDVMEGSVWPA